MILILLVLLRVVSNPLSNLFQKKLVNCSANPAFIIFVVYVLLSAASVPLFNNIFSSKLPGEYYLYMILCAVFAVSSNVILVEALKHGDLSLLGPINSYKPVVGLIFGIILIGEIPSSIGLLGVILILFGSYFISNNKVNDTKLNPFTSFFKDKGVRLRFAALVLSGTEAVFLKKALIYSTPITSMILWCVLGFVISGIVSLITLRRNFADEIIILKKEKSKFFLLFVTTGVMQYSTLLIFDKLQVSYALALFQTSALFSVFLGYRYFNEKDIRKRFAGSLFMIFGSVLIIIYGK